WNDDVRARARSIAEDTDDGGTGPIQHTKDAALGAGTRGARQNLHHDTVAVHSVFNRVARNEDIAVDLRIGRVQNDEPVTVVVEHKPPGSLVPRKADLVSEDLRCKSRRRYDCGPTIALSFGRGGGISRAIFALSLSPQAIAPTRNFGNRTPFFELG